MLFRSHDAPRRDGGICSVLTAILQPGGAVSRCQIMHSSRLTDTGRQTDRPKYILIPPFPLPQGVIHPSPRHPSWLCLTWLELLRFISTLIGEHSVLFTLLHPSSLAHSLQVLYRTVLYVRTNTRPHHMHTNPSQPAQPHARSPSHPPPEACVTRAIPLCVREPLPVTCAQRYAALCPLAAVRTSARYRHSAPPSASSLFCPPRSPLTTRIHIYIIDVLATLVPRIQSCPKAKSCKQSPIHHISTTNKKKMRCPDSPSRPPVSQSSTTNTNRAS